MIIENHLILPQISKNEDLSWKTKSEQQMTKKAEAIWKAPNKMILKRSTEKFQHE